jgi:hypothetical protein
MASKTYKNKGSKVAVSLRDGRAVITVAAGGSYTTSDPDEQHALKLSGLSASTPSESKDDKKGKD